MTASSVYRAHVDELTRRADLGDQDALKSIMIIALLTEGWRYDPEEAKGAKVIELKSYKTRAKIETTKR